MNSPPSYRHSYRLKSYLGMESGGNSFVGGAAGGEGESEMPEELNKKALDVINRVNNKLTGRDFAGKFFDILIYFPYFLFIVILDFIFLTYFKLQEKKFWMSNTKYRDSLILLLPMKTSANVILGGVPFGNPLHSPLFSLLTSSLLLFLLLVLFLFLGASVFLGVFFVLSLSSLFAKQKIKLYGIIFFFKFIFYYFFIFFYFLSTHYPE